ncbi:MAG: ATP-dependent Clp protease proteolytic subunit [Candidatus Margulisiibacteriota bacterium]
MGRVAFYPSLKAMAKGKPVDPFRKGRKVARRRKRNILWMRYQPLTDRGVKLAKRRKFESMVACFDTTQGEKIENPFPKEFFVPDRTIFMGGSITMEVAKIVSRQIRKKAEQDPNSPIILWIASGGGEVKAGKKIMKAMELAKRVSTIAIGEVSSMAAFLVANGWHKYALENANFMFHRVRYSEKVIERSRKMIVIGEDLTKTTNELYEYLANASGKSPEYIVNLFGGRDIYFDSKEAVLEGFIDGVIQPFQYRGFANPSGCKIVFHKRPKQKTRRKVIKMGKKFDKTSGEPASLALRGYLNDMRAYKLIGMLVSHIALNPERDVKLKIINSQGGYVGEGLGLFDVIRLLNGFPNSGNVLTSGSGESIEGVSALQLAAGKRGQRDIRSSTRFALREVGAEAPGHTPDFAVEEIGRTASGFEELIINGYGRHSRLSPDVIREEIDKGLENEQVGFEMTAEEAQERGFVDRVISD